MNNMVCSPGARLVPIRRYMKSSVSPATVRFLSTHGCLLEPHLFIDIAAVGKKVVDFYAAKGGEVVSPLVKAF